MRVETMEELLIEELLIDELKDLYSAEKQILRALPKLAKALSDRDLRDALETHLEETMRQLERLNKVGELVGKKLAGKSCVVVKGLLEEGLGVLDEIDEGAVRDAAVIATSQCVEHYELGGYGAARALAKALGLADVTELLEETLSEEGNAGKKLTVISKQVEEAGQSGSLDIS